MKPNPILKQMKQKKKNQNHTTNLIQRSPRKTTKTQSLTATK